MVHTVNPSKLPEKPSISTFSGVRLAGEPASLLSWTWSHLIGIDIMRPLRVHIDVTHGTATLAQPDPQTVNLNAAQSRKPSMEIA